MDQEKIGRFLQRVRKEQKLTQEQLAERLGVSQKTVSRWETGRNMPDVSMLPELCRELDLNIAELLNGERYPGDVIEKSKVSGAAEGLALLFGRKRFIRNLIGAVVSLAVTLGCMAGLYNREFNAEVRSTDSLEEAIEAYCFAESAEVDVLESTAAGNRLVVLYDRVDGAPGTSGVAILERGFFGKYRFRVCYDRNEFGIYSFQEEMNGKTYLIIACADALPAFVSAYGILGFDRSKGTEIDYDAPEVIYSSPYQRSPFLTVAEMKDGISAAFRAVYYDEDANEYDIFRIAGEMDVSVSGSSGTATGSMEPGLIWWLEAILLLLGILFIRHFLAGMREGRSEPFKKGGAR